MTSLNISKLQPGFLKPKSVAEFFKRHPFFKDGYIERITWAVSSAFYAHSHTSTKAVNTALKKKKVTKKPKPKKTKESTKSTSAKKKKQRPPIEWDQVIPAIRATDPRPIQNSGSDCFFNSFFQVLLNEQIMINAIRNLPEEVAVGDKIGDITVGEFRRVKMGDLIFSRLCETDQEKEKEAKNIKEFIIELKYFISEYSHSSVNVRALRNAFSKYSGISARGQQDVGESWRIFSDLFSVPIRNEDFLSRKETGEENRNAWVNMIPDETGVEHPVQRSEPNPNSIVLDLATEDEELIPEDQRNIPAMLDQARLDIPKHNEITGETFFISHHFRDIPPFLMLTNKRFTHLREELSSFKDFLNYIFALLGIKYKFLPPMNQGKVSISIDVPVQFNLSSNHILNGTMDIPYNLTGFIYHRGNSVHNGHYFSYIRKNDRWFKCNDSRITELDLENNQGHLNEFLEHKNGSYICFYSRNQ